jgi:3-oxoadipate enol-lactonase
MSMGGYVAFALQHRYPERVQGLVLVDTRAEADTEEGRAGRQSMAENVLQRGPVAAVEAMIGKLFSSRTIERQPELVHEVERMMMDASPAAIASAALGMALRPDRTPQLHKIQVPTLVIVGEDDAVTPPATARKMAETLPNATLQIIPEAGHMANMEQPETFHRILADWLASFNRL